MVLLLSSSSSSSSSLPLSIYHRAAPPFPSAAAASRRRKGSLRLGSAGRCSAPAAALGVSASQVPGPTPSAAALYRRRCDCFDLHNQIVPYLDAWAWQKSVVAKRKRLVDRDEDFSDTVIALQHAPVYTLGTANSEEYLRFDIEDPPFEVHRIDRGGQVTYHGPGQLVLYPLLNLHYHLKDLEWYQRALEEVIIRALKSAFSIKASRIDGLTGVWIGDRKVAAIGVYGTKWITYHGLALNVTTDLSPFEMIVPCGIKDYGVVSIKEILQDASDGIEMNDTELMDITYKSLIQEFAEFFNLSLECSPDWSLQGNSSLN